MKIKLSVIFLLAVSCLGVARAAQDNQVTLTLINAGDCSSCTTKSATEALKKYFPRLKVSYLSYPGKEAEALIKELGISTLPAYLLDKGAEKEKGFQELRASSEQRGRYYLLKPEFSGISYFLNRKQIKGRFDLIFGMYEPDAGKLLAAVKNFTPDLHFLAVETKDGFDALKGKLEVEEYLRAVCVQKYYPEKFWDYITCRASHTDSSWWEDCLGGLDTQGIRACARTKEGATLLRENIKLNKELRAMLGPVYLLENRQIFSSQGVPNEEGLRKMLKR